MGLEEVHHKRLLWNNQLCPFEASIRLFIAVPSCQGARRSYSIYAGLLCQ
jgi:hypothetical protein